MQEGQEDVVSVPPSPRQGKCRRPHRGVHGALCPAWKGGPLAEMVLSNKGKGDSELVGGAQHPNLYTSSSPPPLCRRRDILL